MANSPRTLAEGCFGKVYKEKYGDSWTALKKVPVSFLSGTQLERECRVYQNACHPNVVKLLGKPWIDDNKWHIPLEFITGEDLETTIFCSQKSKIQLTPSVRAAIITGMCEGLHHMHLKNIVHQDIKPDNIMVEFGTNRAVIIDLGLAKFFRNGITSAINLGNEAYSAPEILKVQGVRDQRSDVWAMGKVIAELCARVRLPTHAVCPPKIQESLASHPYCKTVCKMVEPNPAQRATMASVIVEIRNAEAGLRAGLPPGARGGIGAGLLAAVKMRSEEEQKQQLKPSLAEVKRSPSPGRFSNYSSSSSQPEELKTVIENKAAARPGPMNAGRQAGLQERGTMSGVQGRDIKQTPTRLEVVNKPLPAQAGERSGEETKALMSTSTFDKNFMIKQCLQQMTPMNIPIPKTGRIQHTVYTSEEGTSGGVLEVKEVELVDGKVKRLETYKINSE